MGSQCDTLRRTDAEGIEIKRESLHETFRISGYGSGSIEALGKAKGTIKAGQAATSVFVYIVPDEVQAISLLVDLPFTEQIHVTAVQWGNGLPLFQKRTSRPS